MPEPVTTVATQPVQTVQTAPDDVFLNRYTQPPGTPSPAPQPEPTAPVVPTPVPTPDNQAVTTEPVPPTPQEKLFAGKYRTPEELEEAFGESERQRQYLETANKAYEDNWQTILAAQNQVAQPVATQQPAPQSQPSQAGINPIPMSQAEMELLQINAPQAIANYQARVLSETAPQFRQQLAQELAQKDLEARARDQFSKTFYDKYKDLNNDNFKPIVGLIGQRLAVNSTPQKQFLYARNPELLQQDIATETFNYLKSLGVTFQNQIRPASTQAPVTEGTPPSRGQPANANLDPQQKEMMSMVDFANRKGLRR